METKDILKKYGQRCSLIAGDISKKEFCDYIVSETLKEFGKIDILVNNVGV